MSNSSAKATIGIIGAGLAGLSCATRLQTLGFQVQVYEKSRGPSGRMSTRNGQGWSADHGAQYFTARDPLFIHELNTWINAGVAALWNPKLSVYEDGQWRQSVSSESRYVGTPAMNSPGKYLAQSLSIEFNHTIDKIFQQNGKWFIHSIETGDISRAFDNLVLAIPAPQATALAKSIHPTVDKLSSEADMMGCWTLMATFTESQHLPFDAAFINNEMISWICRNTSKPERMGQETWTIHTNPQWSQQSIEIDKQDAIKHISECAKMLGLHCDRAEICIHRWRYASGATNLSSSFSYNQDIKLGLCGDWLNGGRVEGAWLSGYKLANAVNHSAEASNL
jgi:renalase